MGKVIDGLTGVEFASYDAYLDHVSPVTGYKPTDPRHHGRKGLLVSKQALKRTGSLTEEKKVKLDEDIATLTAEHEKKKKDKDAEEKAKLK